MTDDSRIEGLVRDWLDGSEPPRSADRVAESVLAALPTIGQESPSGGSASLRAPGAWVSSRPRVCSPSCWRSLVGTAPPSDPRPARHRRRRPRRARAHAAGSLPPGVIAIDMGIDTYTLAVDARSVWVQVGEVGYQRIDRLTNRDTGVYVPEVPGLDFSGVR